MVDEVLCGALLYIVQFILYSKVIMSSTVINLTVKASVSDINTFLTVHNRYINRNELLVTISLLMLASFMQLQTLSRKPKSSCWCTYTTDQLVCQTNNLGTFKKGRKQSGAKEMSAYKSNMRCLLCGCGVISLIPGCIL